MFTVTFRVIRKGISELWTVTDVWSEAMRQIRETRGVAEIVDWETV